MDVYDVAVNEPAEQDLRDIARYISSQLNAPTSALNMVRMIRAAIGKLETDALLHPLVRDDRLAAMGFRPMVVKSYIVFYVVSENEKTVDVDRILYGRRDWKKVL